MPEKPNTSEAEREFIYRLVERGMPRQGLQWMILGAVAAGSLALSGHPAAGGAALAAGFAVGAWSASRSREVILRVERGELVAAAKGTDRPLAKAPLASLVDVRSAQKTEHELVHDVRDLKETLTPSELARVVLVFENESVPLTEDQHPRADTAEWVRRIRVFLRSHGWVPEDEREEAAPSGR